MSEERTAQDVIDYVKSNPNGRVRFDGDAELLVNALAQQQAELERLVEAVMRWERSKWTGDLGEAGRASGEMIAIAAAIKAKEQQDAE